MVKLLPKIIQNMEY